MPAHVNALHSSSQVNRAYCAATAMPTYHNAGGGYPNVSAPARQAKLDGNQNHHTIPSNVTSHPLIQNSTQQQQQQQQHSVPSNLSAGNIPSHPVSPTMTTHSSVTTPNITTHVNAAPSPVILTSNVINPGANTTALPVNPRHEVKLNAMPYVSSLYHTLSLTFTDVTISKSRFLTLKH